MKKFCLLMPVLCLLGCGFSPIYGSHEGGAPVAKELGNVEIANIPDRQGQQLRNRLIDRMYFSGRPEHPEATLAVRLRSTEIELGIRKDATATRRELNMWADYVLRGKDGEQLLKGTAHSVVSYSKLRAQYGTVAAEQNAIDRALKEVGEQIVNRLSLHYAEGSSRDGG
ncbi:MAG: LPS assembly lipoprotein LptE [Alphaproteobacteria bacterium]|nr:LPS assembly lipoprotein LptE [Alphaproteobacteria bacterium]